MTLQIMNDDVKIAMIHNFANQEQHCVRSVQMRNADLKKLRV